MRRRDAAVAVIALLLGATLAASHRLAPRLQGRLALPLRQVSTQIAGWTAVREQRLDEPTLAVLGASAYLSRLYTKENTQLELFVAYYAQQRAGEAMHSPKNCLPGTGWEIWKPGTAEFSIDGIPVRVNRYGIENSGIRRVMFYWYHSADRIIASEYLGKLLLARDTLFTGRTDGSIVRIVLPDQPGAEDEGISFAKGVIPEIQRSMGPGGR